MKYLSRGLTVGLFAAVGWLCADIAPGDPNWPQSYPDWWYNSADPANGVIDATQPVLNQNNDAVLNQGQLWNMAEKGIAELGSVGGASFDLSTFIENGATADYFAPANLGQLKNVSSKFYDRFAEIGFGPTSQGWPDGMTLFASTGYPWALDQTPDNYNIANIGQAKFLFSWSLPPLAILQFLKDSDGDGLTDGFETAFGSDPNLVDTDLDGTTDLLEERLGLDPLAADGPEVDADGDGFPNSYELRWGTDASDASDYPQIAGINQAQDGYLFLVDSSLSTETTYEKSSIKTALAAAADADIIYVKAGTYLENDAQAAAGLSYLVWCEPGSILSPLSTSGFTRGFSFQFDANPRVHGLTISGFDEAIYIFVASPTFYNLKLTQNGMGIKSLRRDSIPYFYNCLITENTGPTPGFLVEGGYPSFINCTFYNNVSTSDAIGYSSNHSTNDTETYLYNCIFWNETAGSLEAKNSGGKLTIDSCIIRDHDGDGFGDYNASFSVNISTANPFFLADALIGAGSPAIDFAGQSQPAPYYDSVGVFKYFGIPDLGVQEHTGTSFKSEIEPTLLLTLDPGQSPTRITLDYSGSSVSHGDLFQVFWDLDGDGIDDETTSTLVKDLPDLLGNLLTVRLLSSQGEELVQTLDFRDSDSDGLPDFWELDNFGHLSATDTDDTDLDGTNNLNEFLNNSDPFDNSANSLGLLVYNL
ncbi:MAG: right-handed parallel beta-helix repeat-containing protein [Verrucomicrobiota bacterium]